MPSLPRRAVCLPPARLSGGIRPRLVAVRVAAQGRERRPDRGRAHALAHRLTLGCTSTLRPWLFCPAGIGDHVDHVAVRTVIAGHLDALGHSYRVAFYEDLHYAADPEKRRLGPERACRRGRRANIVPLLVGDGRAAAYQAVTDPDLIQRIDGSTEFHRCLHAGCRGSGGAARGNMGPAERRRT